MKIYYKIVTVFLILFITSCDLDFQDDPNNLTPEAADVSLLLVSVQTQLASLFNGFNGSSMGYTRMQYQFGNYTGDASAFNSPWSTYYAGILADNQVIIPLAQEKGLAKHAGIAQVIQAYSTVLMVDFFGNIPYSQAIQGTDNPNPEYDNDYEIYASILQLLDTAIANLSDQIAPNVGSEFDIYYNGHTDQWIKLANSLKLKMYVQTKKYNEAAAASGINALLSENNLIINSVDDFEFNYGTQSSAPDTRHPYYSGNYNSSGVGNYMSNSYMYALKSTNDPRLRYYFYRQTQSDPSGAELVCTLPPSPPDYYCYIGDGYWGRDHAIKAGIPGDTQRRTTWGLYPAGGSFDRDQFLPANAGNGAGGAGIEPFMLSSFVSFLKAEAILTIPGVNGNASDLFENGISQSINKVKSFGSKAGVDLGGMQPTNSEISDFISQQVTDFNAATASDKMELLMTQYWISLRGNGIEAYNNYRRTGLPSLQTPLSSGTIFPRSNLYPSNHISTNSNSQQHSVTHQVFWDTNPVNFID
ncbi:MAG TPA: SusD/RagB family nutrient-binding outer membrane lipoprotein [Lutibacter sp.]|nr:SusD/RagB family nutrient-binding outer membrane lipoprotein [Lutibacter sp.]